MLNFAALIHAVFLINNKNNILNLKKLGMAYEWQKKDGVCTLKSRSLNGTVTTVNNEEELTFGLCLDYGNLFILFKLYNLLYFNNFFYLILFKLFKLNFLFNN